MLNQCQLTWTTTITDATVTMSECTARGNLFSGAGLLISSSAVHLARTAVTGGSLKGGGPGIVMFDATVTVAGDASTVIAAAPPPAPPGSSAIGGTGTLTLDPDVVLTATGGAPSIEPGVAVAIAELPTLAAAGAPLGGALQIDLRGESADLFVLLAGVPAAALPVPALRGELWIAPATAIPVASGSLGVSALHSVSFPVPVDPGFIGVHLGWIGVAGASFLDLRFTNNASHTISAD
jgi:hypothetical protein